LVVTEPRNGGEDKLLKRLRVAAGAVTLTTVVLLAVADTAGKFLFGPEFHVSEIIFGTLVGALLAFVGVEALVRLPRRSDP
jgi:uncharacterized membrane protein YgaE (UPF0421/DUF939 family)